MNDPAPIPGAAVPLGSGLRIEDALHKARSPQLPELVKIGAFDYTLELMSPAEAATNGNYGNVNHARKEIQLDPSFTQRQMAKTIVHELLHCAWEVSALADGDVEERIVTAMSNVLAGFWRDNPQLFEFVQFHLTSPTASPSE